MRLLHGPRSSNDRSARHSWGEECEGGLLWRKIDGCEDAELPERAMEREREAENQTRSDAFQLCNPNVPVQS